MVLTLRRDARTIRDRKLVFTYLKDVVDKLLI